MGKSINNMRILKVFLVAVFAFFSFNGISQHATEATADTTAVTVDNKEHSEHQTSAHTGHGEAKNEKFDLAGMIMHHIADSHEWHFATVGEGHSAKHISLPLPVITYQKEGGLKVAMSSSFQDADHNPVAVNGLILEHDKVVAEDGSKVYDFSITKNVAQLILSAILLLLVFIGVKKGYDKNKGKAPSGIQSVFEPIITYIKDEIAIPAIGQKDYKKFLPFLLTLFFFIWFNNMLGLLPGSANVTGNIAVTMVLALITFIVTNANGKMNYWKHLIAPPGVPIPILPVIIPVEILGLFVKPITLMIRLFANITAGHIILLSLTGLIFIFKNYIVGAGVSVFLVAMNLLELLVALLQAFIFTLLTAMYIGSAVEDHHHDTEYDHGM
jgi:F-type H+-transporting ATPase subunit a